ncbi:uncharacterized protein LOC113324605 [Papaver somniferum]|uniref:uncharacterized protein LOC113324605 n=1 Tax=Papaver somniferum TaxID=3469 RepID=UPI000E701BA2|nr:uncharacterized protein LOC113324605 [Papaver somniferum]
MSSSSSSSDSSSGEEITIDQLRSIYKIDRDMYRKLTVNMRKEPLVCMAVMALWLFMEDLGYPNVIPMLLSYPSDIIDYAFEEAKVLVYHILTRTPPPSSLIDTPITLRLIHVVGSRAYIPMKNLYHDGTIPYIEITNRLKDLCCTLFEDIFIEAMSGTNATNTTVYSQRLFNEIGGSSSVPTVEEPQVVRVSTPPSERTMFITFSKEFPITEDQLREYFVGMHGDCIERIDMQEIQPPQRRLMFAKIAFNESETIDQILGGVEAVWLLINGVRVRASKEI